MVEEAQAAPAAIKGLAVGRIVHWVSAGSGEHFAAIITNVHPPRETPIDGVMPHGRVQLAVFHPYQRNAPFVDSVDHDPSAQAKGTWHFPEYVP